MVSYRLGVSIYLAIQGGRCAQLPLSFSSPPRPSFRSLARLRDSPFPDSRESTQLVSRERVFPVGDESFLLCYVPHRALFRGSSHSNKPPHFFPFLSTSWVLVHWCFFDRSVGGALRSFSREVCPPSQRVSAAQYSCMFVPALCLPPRRVHIDTSCGKHFSPC